MGVGCSWVKVLTAEYPEYESDDGCAGWRLWSQDGEGKVVLGTRREGMVEVGWGWGAAG